MLGQISFWTQVLSGASITIDSSYGFKNLSMELVSGTGSFTGSVIAGGTSSMAVPLIVNQAVTVSTGSVNTIDGLTIDATSGVINILAF